jgi:hypothetical protein
MSAAVNQISCDNGHVFDIESDLRPPEIIATILYCQEEMVKDGGLIQPCGARIAWVRVVKEVTGPGGIVFTRNGQLRTMPRTALDKDDEL